MAWLRSGQRKDMTRETPLEPRRPDRPLDPRPRRSPTAEALAADAKLVVAVMLKACALDGYFPRAPSTVPAAAVDFVARQLGVTSDLLSDEIWAGRSGSRHRAHIRAHLDLVEYDQALHRASLIAWLVQDVLPLEPSDDALRTALMTELRTRRVEPPSRAKRERLLRSARRRFERAMLRRVFKRSTPDGRAKLNALLEPAMPLEQRLALEEGAAPPETEPQGETDDSAQVRKRDWVSAFHELRVDSNQPGLDSVKQQIAKLNRIRNLRLKDALFKGVPASLVKRWRQRASLEAPSDLLAHRPTVRFALMAALCVQRHAELTDALVEHLIYSVKRLHARAERRVDAQLVQEYRSVTGKGRLLFRIAEVALERPDSSVKDTVYPVVGESTLRDIVKEYTATEQRYKERVQAVKRTAYRGGYRRVVPLLLNILEFKSNNKHHRPLVQALDALLEHAATNNAPYYPLEASIPLDGLLTKGERALVLEEQQGVTLINRVNYELCVLDHLRNALRCREVWVEGARTYRNPDEDLPKDFDARRAEFYAALEQPLEAQAFVQTLKTELEGALQHFNDTLPSNEYVEILERDDGWIKLTPLEAQPEPRGLEAVRGEINRAFPGTGLIDVLKEGDLRTNLCSRFTSLGAWEQLGGEALRKRLLLTLYALGTNMGLKRMANAETGVTYEQLRRIRKRFVHRDALRAAIGDVVNCILKVRNPAVWGAATTSCASDSKQFGAWDQNLMTEYHRRYGGRGIMVYWHVEKKSACVYSQVKTVSSSEVAAMLEGVLRHCTDMNIERNMVDTHGQSEVGFAFARVFGLALLARFKEIGSKRLYVPDAAFAARLPNLKPVLRKAIDWALIESQYDEIVKFATAIRLGTANAESVLRRFTRANAQHPTYRALIELGKAVKTKFLCEYLSNLELRREVQEGLNVMESWNSANGFIFFGKGGEFSSNRFEDQEVSMLCMHLLQNCLVLVNTLMVQRVLASPERREKLSEADWRGLTPLFYEHVNPYGVFTLDFNSRLQLDDLPQAAD
jgi:TnpA family transposase